MKVEFNKPQQAQAPQNQPQRGGGTYISPNLIKQTVRLDQWGNEIDPRTKQIINPNNKENE